MEMQAMMTQAECEKLVDDLIYAVRDHERAAITEQRYTRAELDAERTKVLAALSALERAPPNVLDALRTAALFLEIGARHCPDEPIDTKFATGERLKTRGLRTVMLDTAKACATLAAPPAIVAEK